MVLYPLCISCGVSLHEKTDHDSLTNEIYQAYYCPNCQEIYQKIKIK